MRRSYALVMSLALLLATPGIGLAAPFERPAGNQKYVEYVIARALSQRGVPFTYGGDAVKGPNRGIAPTAPAPTTVSDPASNVVGFDASGLIVYAFAGAGVKMPRSSGEQYKVGEKVAPAQALPGDLIFYGPEGTESVALFIGNGQMVQGTEPVVTVSPVRTEGMTPYFVRIIA